MANSVQFCCSVMSDSLWPHGCSTPGFPVHHQLPEPAQTHVQWVSDAIQPSVAPFSSCLHSFPAFISPAFILSQHQGLFQWVSFLHQVAKVNWVKTNFFGLPRWHSGKESAWQCKRCRRHGSDPWIRKIPGRRNWQPSPLFLPGESHGQTKHACLSPSGHCLPVGPMRAVTVTTTEPSSSSLRAAITVVCALEPVLWNKRSHSSEKPANDNEE